MSKKKKECPMFENGDCMMRVSVKLTRCTNKPHFQDTTCKPSNCPVAFVIKNKISIKSA